MKLCLALVTFVLLLTSCKTEKPDLNVNQELADKLELAINLRFSQSEVLDTMLNGVFDELKLENSDQLWAKYYFVKAHVEESKSHFAAATLLLDSAINRGLYEDAAYEARVILLEAIINEQLLLFENARNYYNQLCNEDMACQLTSNEKLTVILGKARIAKRLHLPIEKYLEAAEKLITDQPNMNLGLYYSNLAFFSKDPTLDIKYLKLSLGYYKEHDLPLKIFNSYYNLASDYVKINLDSSLYYIQQAEVLNSDSSLIPIIRNSCQQSYYYYKSAYVLYHMENYTEAIKYIDLALPISESLEMENSLFGLKGIKSDILFLQGHYQASKDLAEESSNHFYTYKLKASENKIRYIEAKNHLDDVLLENQMYELNLDNAKLSNRLYLLFSILISIILIFLIYRGKKIKSDLLLAYEGLYKKDRSIFRLEDKVVKVNNYAESGHFPEKTVLSNINKELKADIAISSWDNFYLMYSHKFPDSDHLMRKNFPHLKPKELQFALCEHYGLSDEKIAIIFNVQLTTIRKKRQRLRQVLSLTPNDNIKDYLSQSLTKRSYKY